MKSLRIPGVMVLVATISGCGNVKMTPRIIEADGETFLACKGLVWVSGSGGGFSDNSHQKVTFTDPGGQSHSIWGISKLSVAEPPSEAYAPFPNVLPDPAFAVDVEGKQFENGKIYTWTGGSRALLTNGKWQPVKVASACQ